MAQRLPMIKCKRCNEPTYELNFGLCSDCEDLLEAEHNADPECEHGNTKGKCTECEYEAQDYVKQVNNDWMRGVVR